MHSNSDVTLVSSGRMSIRRLAPMVILSLLGIYLSLMVLAWLVQRKMMYPAPLSASVPKAPGLQLLSIPAGERVYDVGGTGMLRRIALFAGSR